MLKKFLLGFAVAGGLIASAPTASANECLARWGCYYHQPPIGPGYYVCPDPQIYLLCDIG